MLKLRSKTLLTFRQFQQDGDVVLLRDRLKLLTGLVVTRNSFTGKRLPIGLRASHPDLDDLSHLHTLDGLLQSWLRHYSPTGAEPKLTSEQYWALRRLSFAASYKHRIFHKLSGDRLWNARRLFAHV